MELFRIQCSFEINNTETHIDEKVFGNVFESGWIGRFTVAMVKYSHQWKTRRDQ